MPTPKTESRKARASKRRVRALELRCQGKKLWEIAEDIGVTESAACKLVKKAMELAAADANAWAAELRSITNERTDRMIGALWPKALKGNEKAIDTISRIDHRRHKILGTEAPQKIDLDATVTPVPVEMAREKLEAKNRQMVEELVRARLAEKGGQT